MKNIFLDRDGIINKVVLRDKVIGSPRMLDEFKIRQDFFDFYEKLKDKKINIFIVSNQPDVSRKLMTKNALEDINKVLTKHFSFKEICYCTHDNHDNCPCRKPKPGLIINLLNKYSLKKEESCIIGDSYKDICAGKNAGIKTIFLKTKYNQQQICTPDFTIKSLGEVSEFF